MATAQSGNNLRIAVELLPTPAQHESETSTNAQAPEMANPYFLSHTALLLILLTLLVQAFIAGNSKARLPGAIPGKIDPELGQESFVFRAHRTFHNSLENLPLLLGTAFLCLFVATPAGWTAACLWVFALARIIHMVLFYTLASDKNPSPRSIFYLIALLANVGLLGLCGITLLQ